MQNKQRLRDNVCEGRGNWSGVRNQSVVRVLTGPPVDSTGGPCERHWQGCGEVASYSFFTSIKGMMLIYAVKVICPWLAVRRHGMAAAS